MQVSADDAGPDSSAAVWPNTEERLDDAAEAEPPLPFEEDAAADADAADAVTAESPEMDSSEGDLDRDRKRASRRPPTQNGKTSSKTKLDVATLPYDTQPPHRVGRG